MFHTVRNSFIIFLIIILCVFKAFAFCPCSHHKHGHFSFDETILCVSDISTDDDCGEGFHKLVSSTFNNFFFNQFSIISDIFVLPQVMMVSGISSEKQIKLNNSYLLFNPTLRAPPKNSL